ncbi:MAG: ribbon-helix-helix domain-containing protein [Myxococcaceae bacterium]
MIRIQLHLPELQDQRLRKLARRRGVTRAHLIRQGIELVLAGGGEKADPLLDLIAVAGPASRTDLSENHDEVLYGNEPDEVPQAAEPDDEGR